MEELDEPSPIVEERYESQLRDKKEVYDESPEAPKMKKIRSAMAAAPPAPPKPSPVGGGGFGGLVASGAAFSSFADGLTEASEYEELDFDEEDDVLAVLAEKPAAPRKKKGKRAKKRPAPGGSSRTTSQLLYTELQLHAATHSQRGQLEPTDPTTTYIESLQTLSLQINIDVMAVVRNAQEHARTHDHKSLPPGTFDPKQHTGHFDYTYQTDTTVDVPSNGFAHSIAVGSRDAECDLQYVVVPREDTHVYRMALLRNPLHAPLLPGPADIYVGDEYILSTQLPVVAPTGEFRLWLGVEQAIKCARNARFEERRSGTKVVAMTELHHALDIELTNRLPRTIQCEVRERIPYPAPDAEVVVEEGNITPAWEAYEQEERGHILKGGRRWHVSIPAGDTTKLNADYTIKIYANNELIGGNRREA
jgi:hypothetical protein